MDELQVESEVGRGTTVHMKKDHQEVTMDRTLVLIGRAHQGIKRQEIFCLRKIQD